MKEPRIIVYCRDVREIEMALGEIIRGLVPQEDVEVYDSIPTLASRIRRPQLEPAILALFVSDEEDMENLLSIRALLDDNRFVLVLPCRCAPDAIMAGYSLRPRYLSFMNTSLNDVKAVLDRMIGVERAYQKTA